MTGRVGSLLEVGTGFHPELTGRENIFLNGAILGMRRAEIRARFDEIVAFAEIERFLDTPVKRYSSGMSVRLAFAVAAHLEPEILLVDEVLAVGDAAFQRKSLGKMDEVAEAGPDRHLRLPQPRDHPGALPARHPARARRGRDRRAGRRGDRQLPADARAGGLRRPARADRPRQPRLRRDPDPRGSRSATASGGHADVVVAGRPATIAVEVTEALPMMECRLTILNSLGQPVTTLDSEVSAPADVRDAELGPRIECEIDALPLLPGRYRIDVSLKGKRQIQDGLQAAAFFDVEPGVLDGPADADRRAPTATSSSRTAGGCRRDAAGRTGSDWVLALAPSRPSRWSRSIVRRPSRS